MSEKIDDLLNEFDKQCAESLDINEYKTQEEETLDRIFGYDKNGFFINERRYEDGMG